MIYILTAFLFLAPIALNTGMCPLVDMGRSDSRSSPSHRRFLTTIPCIGHLAPPHTNMLPILPDSQSIEAELINSPEDVRDIFDKDVFMFEQYEANQTNKIEFIETKITLYSQGREKEEEIKFSIWMPNRDLGDDFVLVSKPGILTPESIGLAWELLRSM